MDFLKYNIKTERDLLSYLKQNMKYGFVYYNKIFVQDDKFGENMDKFYKLRLGENLLKNKYGVCWDFCELEREFFNKNNIYNQCYFIESFFKNTFGPTHSFCIYKKNNKWFWFEYAWEKYRGIHKYASIKQALDDIQNKFISFYGGNLNVTFHRLEKINKRMTSNKYINFALNCSKI